MSVKERPILFKGEMVRAVIDGRKTETRRIINRVASIGPVTEFKRSQTPGFDWTFRDKRMCWNDLDHDELMVRCPHGVVGDRLWVREMFQPLFSDGSDSWEGKDYKTGQGYSINYVATDGVKEYVDLRTDEITARCTPSIHMPRWASRILLELVAVRVEQVQDITREGVHAEGTPGMVCGKYQCQWCNGSGSNHTWPLGCPHCEPPGSGLNHTAEFRRLWDSINHKRGFGWAVNPWLWVVEFKVIDLARVGAASTECTGGANRAAV